MSKAVLIDGHSILNRAFYGIPSLTNAQGIHTNAILGFLNILFKILDEEQPQYLAVAFDVHAPTFRHKAYSGYKGTRHPMPEELTEQVPVMKGLLRSMHVPVLEKAGYEADDILGTLSRIFMEKGVEVSIISGDRDLLQLATDTVKIRIPKTKKSGTEIEDYYAADVEEKYHVTPAEFIDMKALMGDSSDNVPGVPGIGEKTASRIISTYHSLANAAEHAAEIKPKKAGENLTANYQQAVFSKFLVTIKTDCELDFSPEEARLGDLLNEDSYVIMKKLELKGILSRFEKAAAAAPEEYPSAVEGTDPLDLPDLCRGKKIGLFYFSEDGLEGICIALPGQAPRVYFAGEEPHKLREVTGQAVQSAGEVWTINWKKQLHFLDLPELANVFDAGIAAYLLNPLREGYSFDTIAQDHLGITVPSFSDLFKKKSLAEAAGTQKEDLLRYLAGEAWVPLKTGEVLLQKLTRDGMDRLYREIEMPLVYVLYDMEKFGIRAEEEELRRYGEQLSGRIDELEQDIYDLAGESFNINSPRQLGVILFEKMNLPFAKKTKTGYSTSADILEKLRSYDPIIGKILEYRQLTKLKSTYADGLSAFIDPRDHRIHGKFNQTITATGRISSNDPNLQNIPVRMELGRMIRKVFVPEEGCIFADADYSQIELRVLAHMAQDENLIEAYREEQDIHRMTASKVFHVPFEEVTPLQRRSAKAVNFGIVYGISSFGLSQDLDISRKEAEAYIQQYFETYPGIKAFLDKCVSDAKEKGWSTTMYGRRRPIPELGSKNFMQRSFGERAAMNSPIQGTAADIIKIAMVRVSRRLKKEGLRSRLVLQIHDELLIEAAEDELEEVKRILQEEMTGAAHLAVPLEIDMNTGSSWYQLK